MLVKWTPALPSLFSDFEKAFFTNWSNGEEAATTFAPNVDVIEDSDKFVLRAELPGLKKDSVKITLDHNVLTLSGEKRYTSEKEAKNYHRRETFEGKFERRFRLSDNIDRGNIKADYKDGILEITLPKTAEAQPREISIKLN